MTDRHILFSASMVRALLAGTKTQTRRNLKPQPYSAESVVSYDRSSGKWMSCEPSPVTGGTRQMDPWRQIRVRIGDRLWVKETWRPFPIDLAPWDIEVAYAADGERRIIKDGEFGDNDWTMPKAAKHGNVSPLFMPRWASRLTLIVTDVRVERLQDISEADAIAEGIEDVTREVASGDKSLLFWKRYRDGGWSGYVDTAVGSYASLWTEINGAGAWEANPWVAAYTFTVHRGNIDGSR